MYIHIPFCSGQCTFCYFHRIEKPTAHRIVLYIEALKKEVALTGTKINNQLGRVNVQSIFFGGGSPTILSGSQFTDLLDTIDRYFSLSEDIEITVEIHPEIMRDTGRPLLEQYSKNGVNRLNICVQSFDDTILEITNRRHSVREGIEVFKSAREIGYENINIDLLYPLPGLTPEIWEHTLTTAFDLEPESVTTYFLAIKKLSHLYELHHQSSVTFPDEYTNHLFRIMAIELAKERGYDHRQLIDWFVKPQKNGFHYNHQRNELKNTDAVQLLSFGSGAFSYVNYFQYFNYPDIQKYCDILEKNALPIWRGIHLSTEERAARAMVLGIKSGAVELDEIARRFHIDVLETYHSRLYRLQQLGLLEQEERTLRLSEKGILFADEVAIQFMTKTIRSQLAHTHDAPESERDLIDSYNFIYDINGLDLM